MSKLVFILGILLGFGVGILFTRLVIPNEVLVSDRIDTCLKQGGRYAMSAGNLFDYEFCKLEKDLSLDPQDNE